MNIRTAFACAAVAGLLGVSTAPVAADEERHDQIILPGDGAEWLDFELDTGIVRGEQVDQPVVNRAGAPAQPVSIHSEIIRVPGAAWVRLAFDHVSLSPGNDTTRPSYLRITSLHDGASQYLHMEHVEQWAFTSAYFNGDAVQLEIMAAPSVDPQDNRVVMSIVGADIIVNPASTCGPTDDRLPSNDPRSARLIPIGCTIWLFDDHPNWFATAGHCISNGSSGNVAEFNVPLSNSNGSLNHPPPEDQYVIDAVSIQSNGGGGVGNDYAFCGTFDNSNTGLSAFEAQGSSYQLAASRPPNDGRDFRVTGYGTVTSPISPTWNQAQKTHAGPFVGGSGFALDYQMDTSGGNSGSGVEDENTGLAVGIHTHGGCSSGANHGTDIQIGGFQNYLANPKGVCIPDQIDFEFPAGLFADMINPNGGDSISVNVVAGDDTPAPGTGMIHINSGSGFVAYAMTQGAPNAYTATMPAIDCGSGVQYYFSAETTGGDTITEPFTAPAASFSTLSADSLDVFASYDFQSSAGWTVQNVSLSTGAWETADPGNYGRNDPASDYDGSGRCFVTDNGSNDDVDGGPTRLLSPVFDLSDAAGAVMHYARWFNASGSPPVVQGNIELSDDGGSSWVLVEALTSSTTWNVVEIPIDSYVNLTSQVQFRFSVQDNPNAWIVEAGLDDFQIFSVVCNTCPADINGDGLLNTADVTAFIDAFINGGAAADMNNDGIHNVDDVLAFIDAFLAGC